MIRGCLQIVLCSAVLAGPVGANDWPNWRGPEQTGASREKAVVTSWSPDGPNLLWKSPIGGRTTPIVMNGRVFFLAPVGEGVASQERIVCLDANSGKTVWEKRFNVFHTDIVPNRVGWTAMVGDPTTGYLYAHTTGGEFLCLDRDGKEIWKISLTEELGRISGYGGRLQTPILDEGRVIVSFLNSSWGVHTRPLHRYVAFDKRTGDVQWWGEPGVGPLDTTYSAPVVAVIGGRRLLIAANADGYVYGMLARTGKRVWSFRLSKRGINSSVVVDGSNVYVCHSEENIDGTVMGRVVCIDGSLTGDITESGEVWRRDGLKVGYASPAVANGRLYVVDNSATLYALDGQTGKTHWRHDIGRVGKGSPTVTADGVIYVGEQNGVFHVLKDAGDHVQPLAREVFSPTEDGMDEIFGSPAVANGRVYFMTRYHTYCLGRPDTPAINVPIPPMPPERFGEKLVATHILAIPQEKTLRPGTPLEVKFYAYDDFGQIAKGNELLLPDGRIAMQPILDESGLLLTGTFRAVPFGFDEKEDKAPLGELSPLIRSRCLPNLPFVEDFSSIYPGETPLAWIGAGGGSKKKIQVVNLEGEKMLVKNAKKELPSPGFMRLRTYMTRPEPIGYTVQCDMMSELRETERVDYLPDMGLINCRYRLIMLGADRKRGGKTKLRIESWSPLPRFQHDVEFDWKPDTWYTVKFEVALAAGGAQCRAKVWPRDKDEPKGWNLVALDPYPNTEGSAGLYCYSTGTTAKSDGPATYFDNLEVKYDD